jgi:hypothetical protein
MEHGELFGQRLPRRHTALGLHALLFFSAIGEIVNHSNSNPERF